MNYDLWGYINTGGLKMPSIKKQISENSTFRVLANLVWHCNEHENNEVYVGCVTQARETKMGRSTILLARKALTQAGWYIYTGEKKLYGAWVYRLEIPGFADWLGLNSQTTYEQATGTNSQTDNTNVGLNSGLDNGSSNGLDNGSSNGATSQPQTELNQININTTEHEFEQILIRKCKKLELQIIPCTKQVPFDNICKSKNTQATFLPVVRQALKRFGNKSANDRDCAVYVLSKIHPDNNQFRCTDNTYQTLSERYLNREPDRAKLIDGQNLLGDLAKNFQNQIDEPF